MVLGFGSEKSYKHAYDELISEEVINILSEIVKK